MRVFNMALVEGIQILDRLDFPVIVLWLLSFALVYGLLSHIGKKGMPESNIARAIIGIVAAFFVLMSVPVQLISVLSSMSTGLVLLVIGILVFMVFIELVGVRVGKYTGDPEMKDGKPTGKYKQIGEPGKLFETHSHVFAILLIIFALLVFVAAGGLNLLGFNIFLNSSTTTTLLIIGVIVLAVYWLIKEKNE